MTRYSTDALQQQILEAEPAGLHSEEQVALLAMFQEAPEDVTPAGDVETNPVRDLQIIHTVRGQIRLFCTPDMRMIPALEICKIPELQDVMKRMGLDAAGREKLKTKLDEMTEFVADASDPTCKQMEKVLKGYTQDGEECRGATTLCRATTTQKNDNKHCFRYYCFTWPCPAGNNCRSNQCIQRTGAQAPEWRDQDKLGCDKWFQYNLAQGIQVMKQHCPEAQWWPQYAKILTKYKKVFTALVRCELWRERMASKKDAHTQRAQQKADENAEKAKNVVARARSRRETLLAAPVRNPLATASAGRALREAEAEAEQADELAMVAAAPSRRQHRRGRGGARARSPSIDSLSSGDRSQSPPPRRSPRKHTSSGRDRDRSPPDGSRGRTPHREHGGGRSRPRNATNPRPRGGGGRRDHRPHRNGDSRRPRDLDERYQDF